MKDKKSRTISKWIEYTCSVFPKSELKPLRQRCQTPKFPSSPREYGRIKQSQWKATGNSRYCGQLRWACPIQSRWSFLVPGNCRRVAMWTQNFCFSIFFKSAQNLKFYFLKFHFLKYHVPNKTWLQAGFDPQASSSPFCPKWLLTLSPSWQVGHL